MDQEIQSAPIQLDITMSQEVDKLFAAMAKAQGKIQGARKDQKSHHGSYADLASVWDACRSALSENGIAVLQPTEITGGGNIVVKTILGHSSGQWIVGKIPVIVKDKTNAQAMGSGISYARRYSLSSIVGISPSEDDGNLAVGTSHPQQSAAPLKNHAPTSNQDNPSTISPAQAKRLFAIAKNAGYENDAIKDITFKLSGRNTSKDLVKSEYDVVCKYFENNPAKVNAPPPPKQEFFEDEMVPF